MPEGVVCLVNYLIRCRSLTYAQRTARALERAGISSIVTRTPQYISDDGCGYCVKLSEKRLSEALVVMKNAGLQPGKIYIQGEDGRYGAVPQ